MMPKDSPVLCPACRQDVPSSIPDLNYFAGNLMKPAVDDVGAYLDDLRDIISYIESLFKLLAHVDKSALDYDFLYDCLHLGWELSTQARKRQYLADDAWTLIEKRLYEAAHATPSAA